MNKHHDNCLEIVRILFGFKSKSINGMKKEAGDNLETRIKDMMGCSPEIVEKILSQMKKPTGPL